MFHQDRASVYTAQIRTNLVADLITAHKLLTTQLPLERVGQATACAELVDAVGHLLVDLDVDPETYCTIEAD